MTVIMANAVGFCDNFESAGQSAVLNNQGIMLDHLEKHKEGILVFDTLIGISVKRYLT